MKKGRRLERKIWRRKGKIKSLNNEKYLNFVN